MEHCEGKAIAPRNEVLATQSKGIAVTAIVFALRPVFAPANDDAKPNLSR
jgi:hypothetical protein